MFVGLQLISLLVDHLWFSSFVPMYSGYHLWSFLCPSIGASGT